MQSKKSMKTTIMACVGALVCLSWMIACSEDLKPVENVDISACALNSSHACPCDGIVESCDDGTQCVDAFAGSGGACLGDCGGDPYPCTAYCAMEIACIPTCLGTGGMTLSCSSPEVVKDCSETCEEWYSQYGDSQGNGCGEAVVAWMSCVSSATCEDVMDFFTKQPDAVELTTPCADEFNQIEANCTDFNPRTEYSLREDSGDSDSASSK